MQTNFTTTRRVKLFIVFVIAKLGFTRLNPGNKVSKTRSVAEALAGNPNFPNTSPTVAELLDAATELQTAIKNARNQDKEMIAIRKEKELYLNKLMYQLQLDITRQAKGDTAKILSAGFEPSSPRTKVGKLGPVESLTARPTLVPGEVTLKWKALRKTKVYVVQMASSITGPDVDWQFAGESTKAILLITGLTSGQMMFFRVACVTSAGMGDWSEAISCKAY